MYSRKTIETEISDRFRVPAPTALSPVGKSPPLVFSRLRSAVPMPQKSKPARPEDAYAVHVLLGARADVQLWLNGREVLVPPLHRGGLLVGHLESTPSAAFNSDFDFIRFYISKATLDELAEGADLPHPDGLLRPDHGARDPVLYHLAAAAAPLIQRPGAGGQLLLDHLALAFHSHLLGAYGGAPRDARPSQSNLAPWQERRAKEFIDANLARNISVLDLAEACGLSASHFSRAFRISTGRPPHRWLLERRVEAAKVLLVAGDVPLAKIAADCGFSDPSHFSRMFLKTVGLPPAAWRRSHRH
jgi:AraC-like DNA-binding protein